MKIWRSWIFVALTAVIAAACTIDNTAITGPKGAGGQDTTTVVVTKVDTSLTIPQTSVSLVAGPSTAICTASPPYHIAYSTNPAGLRANWTSGNTLIAKVDTGANVTALSSGTVVITGVLADKPSVTATVIVTVTVCAPPPPSPSITLFPILANFHRGSGCVVQAYQLQWDVKNAGTAVDVVFSSSQNGVFTIGSGGLITPQNVGTEPITATLKAFPTVSSTITATVDSLPCTSASASVIITVLTPGGTTMHVGATQQLSVTFKDKNGAFVILADSSGTWASSQPEFVLMNTQQGIITAFSAATNPPGAPATSQITFTLRSPPAGVNSGAATITVVP